VSAFPPKADVSSSSLSSGALLLPAASRSRTDVFRHATALAVNETLRFAPATRHSELAPHLWPSTLQEVDAIRIAGERQLQREIEIVTFTVAVDQSL